MGFARFIGSIVLGILAVLLAFLGFVILLGFFGFIPSSFDIPLGIIALIAALFLFVYGWYSYKSAQPKGTVRVEK